MPTNSQIASRFLQCIAEVSTNLTLEEIADKIGANRSYLTQLKTKKSTKINPALIGKFCVAFNYSANWILTGRGEKKYLRVKTREDKLTEHNEQLLETIRDLLRALIELRVHATSAQKELINRAKRYNKS